ncbi:MAG: gamma-glutamyl-gamma-aminobutyrate hydrolase family protein, partial [Pseudomonadota bacterium]
MITGSPAGVYEDHPWIAPLEDSIREWTWQNHPVVGICFGHQIMAQALGGMVQKSDRGWGVGLHTYNMA